jgi:hypothetical protein
VEAGVRWIREPGPAPASRAGHLTPKLMNLPMAFMLRPSGKGKWGCVGLQIADVHFYSQEKN